MVEVSPRSGPIRIQVWRLLLSLGVLAGLALLLLWLLLGTQWGATNPFSEWARRFLAPVNRFRPTARPEDNLPSALRIHGFEKLADRRYALLFSATDRKGEPLSSLTPADVTVLAGAPGARQPATVARVTPLGRVEGWNDKASFACVMDYSGSMFAQDIRNIESEYKRFLGGLQFPSGASVYKFHQSVYEIRPFSQDRSLVEEALARPLPLGPATALHQAMEQGALSVQGRPHLRALLLTTDGNNNVPGLALDDVLRRCRQQYLSAFVFGFGWLNVEVLRRIAEETDGYYVYVPDSAQLKDWFPRLAGIVNHIQVAECVTPADLPASVSLELRVIAGGLSLTRIRE